MTVTPYTLDQIPEAPATLLNPARKIFGDWLSARKNRDAQSLMLSVIARNLDESGHAGVEPDRVKTCAYASVNESPNVLAYESVLFEPGATGGMNISGIQTRIIQEAGRWCVRYASDVLVELAMLAPFENLECDPEFPDAPRDRLIAIGLRENGSDGVDGVMHNLRESMRGTPYVHPDPYYRKLLGVLVRDTRESGRMIRREMALIDLTHDVYRLDPEDEKKPDSKFEWDDNAMDPEIEKRGLTACWLDAGKSAICAFVRALSEEAGVKCDWSYTGGRAHVDVLPEDFDKAEAVLCREGWIGGFAVPYDNRTASAKTWFTGWTVCPRVRQ